MVIVGTAGEPRRAAIRAAAEAGEMALRGAGAVELLDDAARRIVAEHSRAPAEPPEGADQLLEAALREASARMARDDEAGALVELERIEALDVMVRDQLRREPVHAQRLFRACVLAAYLRYRQGARDAAQRDMTRCAADDPGASPSATVFAPAVRRLFFELAGTSDAEGWLRVRSRGRRGCQVHLNGRPLGEAPLRMRVRPGEARVQLDCGDGLGRVHTLTVGAGEQALEIDPRFDAVLRSNAAGVWLRYPDVEALEAHGADHARRVGEVVGAQRVLFAALWKDQAVWHDIDVAARRLVAAQPAPGGEPTWPQAVADLMAEPPASDGLATAQRDVDDRYRTLLGHRTTPLAAAAAGATVGAAWAGTLFVSAGLLSQRAEDRERARFGEVPGYRGSAMGAQVLAGLGSALWLVPDLTVWPDEDGVTWWGWLVGGLGAAAVAGGGLHWALADTCELGNADPGCREWMRDPLLGRLLLLHGLGPLSVPLSQLIADWLSPGRGGPRVSVSATPSAAWLTLGGAL